MVDDLGQLYTLEGLAAGVLMILTAYLVMNMTTVLTPGDTHVNDMQLAQLGNDVLRMMDIPDANNMNIISDWILYNNTTSKDDFKQQFDINWPDEKSPGIPDAPKYIAKVYYRNEVSGEIQNFTFCTYPEDTTEYLRENAVTVTRWVTIDNDPQINMDLDTGVHTVLLEVLIWRD